MTCLKVTLLGDVSGPGGLVLASARGLHGEVVVLEVQTQIHQDLSPKKVAEKFSKLELTDSGVGYRIQLELENVNGQFWDALRNPSHICTMAMFCCDVNSA